MTPAQEQKLDRLGETMAAQGARLDSVADVLEDHIERLDEARGEQEGRLRACELGLARLRSLSAVVATALSAATAWLQQRGA